MKKLLILFAIFIGFVSTNAQNNPFAELGYEPKIATLSNGQFNESFDNDTIVQIGSVMFNTKSKQIVAFVEIDTMYSEATLEPDIVSRWISPDPLADHPMQIGKSPYQYAWNNPVYWTDPDGQCPFCPWLDAVVDVGFIIYDVGVLGYDYAITGTTQGEDWAALSADVLSIAVPMTVGAGLAARATYKAAKTVDKAVDVAKTVDKASDMQKAVQRGRVNEAKTILEEGLTRNTKTYKTIDPKTGKSVNVKPDAINANKVTEIKDTKTLSNTKQIRGERQVAKEQGKGFEIITGKNTKVSKNIPKKEIKRVEYLGPQNK